MVDSFSETTSEGWGTRLKNAIVGIGVGFILLIGSFPVLWWNEGRAVTQTKSLEEGASTFKPASAETIDPSLEGKLVYLSGHVAATEPANDTEFGVAAKALGLKRTVEMYQWKETKRTEERKKLGGGTEKVTTYEYDTTWDEDLIDSSSFRKPDGHENPSSMPYRTSELHASSATLGARTLDSGILSQIENWQSFAPAVDETTPLPEGFRSEGNGFYYGDNPGSPRVGDMRVTYEQIPEGAYSFIAAQRGGGLGAMQTQAGNELLLIENGTVPPEEMFKRAHTRNTILTWVIRGVGFFMMWIGLGLLFKPLSVMLDVIPLLGNIAEMGIGFVAGVLAFIMSMTTIAFAWLFYRPLIGIALLVFVAAGFFMLRGRKQKVAHAHAHAPPPMPAPAGMPPPPPR